MLVVMPLALFLPTSLLSREWSIALLLLGAMPTGMTIALMAEFFGGKTSLALVITTVTSLLAPFTIPVITKIAVGQQVDINMFSMFWSLFLTIVAPFVLAMLVQKAVPKQVAKHDAIWRNLSVAAFGVLITGIVANTQGGGGMTFTLRDAWMMLISMALLGTMTWTAYHIVRWRSPADRMTIALCMLYMNNTLALFVGERFFKELGVVPKQILLLLVVNALLPMLKLTAMRILGTKPQIPVKI
jgi:BASS family bile acid:Na+ symporter